MSKASWRGYEIYEVVETCAGWAQILFKMNGFESPITGTGRRWVPMNEIVVEEE